MTWYTMKNLFTVFIVIVCLYNYAESQDDVDSSSLMAPDSLIRVIDSDSYQIGNLYLNRESREITIPGWINLDDRVVEYFAVAPGGKTHESVLVLDIQPLHLQIALLLFGLDYGQNLAFQGDSALPKGDSVNLAVAWVAASGDSVTHPATDLLFNVKKNEKLDPSMWVFSGSIVWNGRFMADMEGSIIATFADPTAILNIPFSGRMDDTMVKVNKQVVPKPGTPVKLIITIPKQ